MSGDTVLVHVSDTSPWAWVDVWSDGPCGKVQGSWVGVVETEGVWTWTFDIGVVTGGNHLVSFTKEQGVDLVVSAPMNVGGESACGGDELVCPEAGVGCVEDYPIEATCEATGVSKVVMCHKEGVCTGVGDGPMCSWGDGSWCADPCETGGAPPDNRFGIGLVGPGDAYQLDLVHELTGDGGHALLIFAGITKATTGPEPSWVSALQGVYDRGLVPVVRLGPPWGQMEIRAESDDAQHLEYKGLAAAYRKVVEGLPLHEGTPLYIQVHNEPNLCYEWACSGGGTLGSTTIAAEYAGYFRDVADALHAIGDPRIEVSLGAMAPGGVVSCECCGPAGGCAFQPGETGLDFMAKMEVAVPDVWTRLDFLASHAYPAQNIGWGFFLSFAQSMPGLTYFELELNVVGPSLPVLITETGWSTERPEGGPKPSAQEMADWTVLAWEQVWLTHPNIVGVMPFMLVDAFWGDDQGFGWVLTDGTKRPVFNDTRALRCSLGLGPC